MDLYRAKWLPLHVKQVVWPAAVASLYSHTSYATLTQCRFILLSFCSISTFPVLFSSSIFCSLSAHLSWHSSLLLLSLPMERATVELSHLASSGLVHDWTMIRRCQRLCPKIVPIQILLVSLQYSASAYVLQSCIKMPPHMDLTCEIQESVCWNRFTPRLWQKNMVFDFI